MTIIQDRGSAIHVQGLKKSFKDVHVLRGDLTGQFTAVDEIPNGRECQSWLLEVVTTLTTEPGAWR